MPKAKTYNWLILVLVCLCCAACAVNPVSGEQQLAMMSEAQEVALGQQAYPATLQQFYGLPPQDPGLQAYVSRVGQRLARVSHRPHLPWRFSVVNSDQINAFALPGGKVAITRGLITRFKNEDELAFVLGHEIGHVTARHHVAQHARSSLMNLGVLGLGVALGGTGYGGVAQQAAGLAGGMALMAYSRDQERQADDLGSEYMIKAGYNPNAQLEVMRLFLSLKKIEPGFVEGLFASHPMDEERLANSQARLAKLPADLTKRPYQVAPFQQALAVQTQRAPAYRAAMRGDEQLEAKRFGQAAASYQEAARLFGGDGMFHTKRALALWEKGSRPGALRAADQGSRVSPELVVTNYVAAQMNANTGRWLPAARAFDAMTAILPSSAEVLCYAGYSYEKAGRRQEAASRYQRAARLDPYGEWGQTARHRLNNL